MQNVFSTCDSGNLFLTLFTTLSGLDVGKRSWNWVKVSLKHIPGFTTGIDFVRKKLLESVFLSSYFPYWKSVRLSACLQAVWHSGRISLSFFRRLCETVFPHIQAIETGFWCTFSFIDSIELLILGVTCFSARRNHFASDSYTVCEASDGEKRRRE